ncbi:MAG: amidohydrolase family protein [Pirellulaceae bacterium]|jgi:predicted TIM-barrel fold metal-dependent hydrolase|nr:amidohydrolase family protein [Pirellulaceae bacterium]MDP7017424.1 amidohydrolase family protein [Pirellulaceae bacterium]
MPNQIDRRTLLQSAGAAPLALSLATDSIADQKKKLVVVDCHAHIYGEDEKKYPTIEKPYRPPAGKGTVAHLQAEMKAAGVDYVTVIQTSTFYRFDNRFTADTARLNPRTMAGVVTLDPDNPASPEMLEKYVGEYNVRGMRSIPAKSGRLDDPGVARLWKTAERLGIVINALVGRDKRSEIESLAKRHPQLRIVIDHCLNLRAGEELKPTLKDVAALAKLPLAHAKLTFIPTGSGEAYPCRDMHDACRAVIDAFGPNRCVWGSDFPCELWCPKVTYAQHLKIFTEELRLDDQTRRAVLGETARRLWFQKK